GEVHVQQGAILKKLLPGEQVTTAPSIKPVPVAEEISWSRNAEEHLALLQQAVVTAYASAISSQNRQGRQTFESVSINARSSRGADIIGRLGGGLGCGGRVQLDSKEFAVSNTTLYNLITLAYGISCRDSRLADLVAGGPAWINSDHFDIKAALPDGSPS